MRQGLMIIACGFEPDNDGTPDRSQIIRKAVIVCLRSHHGHASASSAFRPFEQHLLAVLGHIDGY